MPEIQADKRALLADKRTVERNITNRSLNITHNVMICQNHEVLSAQVP
jgi:hypothetical protein